MKTRFRPYSLDQILLLPPDLRDWLPDDHLALFISDVVDELDLSKIFGVCQHLVGLLCDRRAENLRVST